MPNQSRANHIHLIVTGGTIDSYFDKSVDTTALSSESQVRAYLEKVIEPHFTLSQKVVSMKDSRDLGEQEREKILQDILHCGHDRILITHGTYTMPETAQFLLKNKKGLEDKIIVISGGFYPLARYSETDASFNLGFAIASLFLAKPGVYVAMNGKLFDGDKVKKDLQQARLVDADDVRSTA